MASPVGHSLIAVSIVLALSERFPRRQTVAWLWHRRWILLGALFLANLPDLDYVPGLVIGDLNAFHHGFTHSLGFAVAVWLLLVLAGRWGGVGVRRWALLAGLLLLSHLLVDVLTADGRAPYGILLFWPMSEAWIHSPFSLFPMYSKAQWADLWQGQNLGSLLQEMAVSGSLLLAVWWIKTRDDTDPDNAGTRQAFAHPTGEGEGGPIKLDPR